MFYDWIDLPYLIYLMHKYRKKKSKKESIVTHFLFMNSVVRFYSVYSCPLIVSIFFSELYLDIFSLKRFGVIVYSKTVSNIVYYRGVAIKNIELVKALKCFWVKFWWMLFSWDGKRAIVIEQEYISIEHHWDGTLSRYSMCSTRKLISLTL